MHDRPWQFAVNIVAANRLTTHETRHRIYRRCGLDIQTVDVRPGQEFRNTNVHIGAGSMIGASCRFASGALVHIGQKCWIGTEALFVTDTHELGGRDKRAGEVISQPVRVDDGCWFGARVTVLPGVSVGAGCIVAAGAVVTCDCEPDGLYAGVPAVRKRDLHQTSAFQ